MDMGLNDYDARTPLHVASAEGYFFTFTYIFRNGVIFSLQNAFCVWFVSGHVEVVLFLTKACQVNPFVKDRYITHFIHNFSLKE